ncbi:hydroxymethylglutaryl-CoA lyase [Sphingobium chlorophenolicum]|uniref:Hydroxymethylglutaryl-CoA lyase n=1 Tax=Sphingobium chlorophenolicum TaxID=46429 RepID=A0A081RED2_SPHCR|nr:hydroxymethylglutaryl-CoA lyase [Sphingobium chlorophenolicum]KEQ53555.1 Hydroxymethylglutaryl-CoA lyase [Sphingobium chlorophenolicum]
MSGAFTLVEVGTRDGFQPIAQMIPTQRKIEFLHQLHAAGTRRIEATAFVSDAAVPQLADAAEVLAAAQALPGLDAQVLVPNLKHAERAWKAGATHLAFVLSASEKHNRNNVKRSPAESVQEYARIVDAMPSGTKMRLNVATAFDCPFDGAMPPQETLALLGDLVPIKPDAEICPCDTTGRVTPDRVAALFGEAKARFPDSGRWAYHGHDTYGLGVANALAAWNAGVTVIDAAFGGLGGCPFAPGATGNVATEDVIWTFEAMGVSTGIDLDLLLEAARAAALLPGGLPGGRVRQAVDAALCLARESAGQ